MGLWGREFVGLWGCGVGRSWGCEVVQIKAETQQPQRGVIR